MLKSIIIIYPKKDKIIKVLFKNLKILPEYRMKKAFITIISTFKKSFNPSLISESLVLVKVPIEKAKIKQEKIA